MPQIGVLVNIVVPVCPCSVGGNALARYLPVKLVNAVADAINRRALVAMNGKRRT